MTPETVHLIFTLVPYEFWNTCYMVLCATALAILGGFPLGIILTLTDQGHLKAQRCVHQLLGSFVNIGRSFPFAILMVALIPVTRWIVGTSLGTTAAIIPLSLAAIPFLARLVEAALKEVDTGVVEAAVMMGSTTRQIITKVLLPEAWPSLILAVTTTVINLIGYSAMAGTMGGGGLGKIAIQYGYQRFNLPLMFVTVILLIILVQAVQWMGQRWATKIQFKRSKGAY